MCPGDTLVFTCTTDTGALIWYINGTTQNAFFIEADQLNSTESLDIFTLSLIDIIGATLVSTATVQNVNIENNGTIIICSDINNQIKTLEVRISGIT